MVTPPVLQELQNARYQVNFVDSTTGAAITDPLKVSFAGAAALKAADGTTLNDKSVTTSAGTVFVSADFSASASDFAVQVADAGTKGWLPTGTRVVGSAGLNGDQVVLVEMINTNKAAAVNASTEPVAMAVDKSGSVTATGATAAPIVVATQPKTVTTEEGNTATIGTASVAIAAGTVGTTATGAPAAAGPLTVSNTYYSNATTESLAAFPGGFAAAVEVPPAAPATVLNGVAPEAATLITAGFAQFNVTDSAGNPIKNFDKPLTLGIDMPKSTLDANGNAVVVGGQFPVWSYDEAAGAWKFEKMGTIAEKTPVDASNFVVQFETTHLSSWALNKIVASCTATVNLSGRAASDARPLTVEAFGDAGARFSFKQTITNSTLSLPRAPGIRGTIVVKDGTTEVGRVTTTSFCAGAINVPVTLPVTAFGQVRMETFESCADGTRQRAVPAPVSLAYTTTTASGYSRQAATADTFAQASFASIPVGTVKATALNPRTGLYVTTTDITRGGAASTSTVVEGGTTVFRFNFPMQCQVLSGS